MLWLGTTSNGFVSFDPETGDIRRYLSNSGEPSTLVNSVLVTNFAHDYSERLWIASRRGLYFMDAGTDIVKPFSAEEGSDIRFEEEVWAVIADRKGNVLAGTNSGLLVIDKDQHIQASYSLDDGLLNEQIYSINIDRDENLWLGTGNGIARIDNLTSEIKTFTPMDGLPISLTTRVLLPVLTEHCIIRAAKD